MAKRMSRRRHQPCISGLLLVLILAVAVQATTAQLTWDKLPLFGRFAKAAQAAKAAAAAITVSHSLSGKTPSLPPTPPVAAPSAPGGQAGKTPQQPAMQLFKFQVSDGGKKGKKNKELKQLPVTGKNETQAGCSCLTNWEAKPGGVKLSGCANPDNDPLGAWCQVDPAQCLGYYSMFRTEKNKLRFYDYCVPVRERTKKGCLCSSDWTPGEGNVGKAHYRDGCARPHAAQGARICKVDAATCPAGVDPLIEQDECADRVEQMVLTQDKTWHNCGCVQGWSYKYEDGTSAIFSTCANPDADPLGHWCEVDPTKCDNFATILKNGNQKMSIGYCQSKYKPPQPAGCKTHLKLNDQCGGKSNCTHSGCLNAPWPGACCPRGAECRMQDAFYYQCMPLDADLSIKTYKTAPVSALGVDPSAQSPPASAKKQPPAPLAAVIAQQEIAMSTLEDAGQQGEGESAGEDPREAGPRVWVKLRLGMDYDLLVASPQRLAQFKSDVAQWLREVVGNTKYIYGTGVDEVLAGSVIAVSYVDFTKDAPTQAVDAAMEELHTNGQNQFAESQLPAKWGWLLSYNMGQNKTDMMQDGPGEIQIQSLNFPAGAGKPAHRAGSKLSLTVTIVIAVGGLAVGAFALVCAIVTVRHRRARRKQQGAKKPTPKQSPQKGGGGASGYLADLDGMDDGTSDKSKTSIDRSSRMVESLARMGAGLRHAVSSRDATLNLNGSTGTSMSPTHVSKRPSDSGGQNSRLWNWLQKAESPAAVENAIGAHSGLSSPEVSCNISATIQRSKETMPARTASIMPTPRGGATNANLDLSDPGSQFRVPPPSPRYTDRAASASPAEAAAAAAVAAASAAAAFDRSAGSPLISPRPAPAGAALLLNQRSAIQSTSAGRRGTCPAMPPSAPMLGPRAGTHSGVQYDGSAANHPSPRSYSILDPMGSCGTIYTTISDYANQLGGQAQLSNINAYGISTINPTTRMPAGEAGDLPPGISMGPFLRAAIKSLTGQSLGGRSAFDSDAGAENPAGNASGGYAPGPGAYSNQASTGRGGSASMQQGQGMGSSNGYAAQSVAARQAAAEQQAAEDPSLGAGSGSVFQSLWMQRLVAAAQAQQTDMMQPPTGRAGVRLEDAHMYGQPRQ